MSIEVIPNGYRHEFDPFADISPEKISEYAEYQIGNSSSVAEHLNRKYRIETANYTPFIERMTNEARFLEPVDDNLKYIDQELPNVRTFCSGLMLATTALDILAGELDVKPADWRTRWQNARPYVDLGHVKAEDVTPAHYMYNGGKIVNGGMQAFNKLNESYKNLFNRSNYLKNDESHAEIYQASYGLSMHIGQKVLYSFAINERLDAAVNELAQDFNPEKEITHLISKRERRSLRKELRHTHQNRSISGEQ